MSATEQKLMSLYGGAIVRLSLICDQYLGNKLHWARRRANAGTLPFPAFRREPVSHKSPWFVMVSDLAKYVDKQSKEAQRSWEQANLN